MTISRQFCLIALLFVSAGAMAQVVECIDANGKKTYAKECPANTVKEKELDHPALVSPGAAAAPDARARMADAEFQQRRAQRQAHEAEQEQREAEARNAAQACSDARARLDTLQTGRPSRRVDPVTGDHVVSDDTQLQTEIDGLNAQIAQNCK